MGRTEYSIEDCYGSGNVKITRVNSDGTKEFYVPRDLILRFVGTTTMYTPPSLNRKVFTPRDLERIINSRFKQVEHRPKGWKLKKLLEYAEMHNVDMSPWQDRIDELEKVIVLHEVHDT